MPVLGMKRLVLYDMVSGYEDPPMNPPATACPVLLVGLHRVPVALYVSTTYSFTPE